MDLWLRDHFSDGVGAGGGSGGDNQNIAGGRDNQCSVRSGMDNQIENGGKSKEKLGGNHLIVSLIIYFSR